MTIEEIKNAKLSEMTAGYLAIYLKLDNLLKDVSDVTSMEYSGVGVDDTNEGFCDAIYHAMDEVMKLANMSITEKLGFRDNHIEI